MIYRYLQNFKTALILQELKIQMNLFNTYSALLMHIYVKDSLVILKYMLRELGKKPLG